MKLAEQQKLQQEQLEQIRREHEAKIRDITNKFSISSLGYNIDSETRGLVTMYYNRILLIV